MTKQSLNARNRLRNLSGLLRGVYPEEVEGLATTDCRALQARNDDVNRSNAFVLVSPGPCRDQKTSSFKSWMIHTLLLSKCVARKSNLPPSYRCVRAERDHFLLAFSLPAPYLLDT